MDNLHSAPPERVPSARFVPDRRYTALAAAGGLAALGAALGTSDPRGRLLALVALAIVACYMIGDLAFSPRLEATADGLCIRSPFLRTTLRWDEIESVRVFSRHRGGVRSSVLEVDAGAVTAEFSRRSLATDPDDALALVLAFRPS